MRLIFKNANHVKRILHQEFNYFKLCLKLLMYFCTLSLV